MKRSVSNEINRFIISKPGLSHGDLSELILAKFGQEISPQAVYRRRKKLDAPYRPSELLESDKRVEKLKTDKLTVNRKYRNLLKENERLQNELDLALSTSGKIKMKRWKEKVSTGGSEAVAVVVASDWHLEEQVLPEKVNYLNNFNLQIAELRVREFFENTVKLLEKEQRSVKIETMVLALLGDFISSNIHEELLENCLLRPAEAIIFAENLLANGIQYLLDKTSVKVIVPCHVGNHTRITRRVHVSTEQGNSLETIMYHHLARYFKDEPRIEFRIANSYHSYLTLFNNFTIRFHHGHGIRYQGGVGGIFIPARKAVAQWQKLKRADLDVFGHFHSMKDDGGNFICNGSIIGYNAFAVQIKADFETPRQVFFLVDKKRGKTGVFPILFSK